MRQYVYNPNKSGTRMNIVCFVSGSGTNYREIVNRNPQHNYLVFTNRPGCGGTEIARQFGHQVIELSHVSYLSELRKTLGAGNVPRNCPEREAFEKEAVILIEEQLGRKPDLICLAGYDQVNTDWFVDRYFPRVLNVHPGDNTKGYAGLHWVPAAKAILAGEEGLRSTLFFIDKGLDTGAVLVQSKPLSIAETLARLDRAQGSSLLEKLKRIRVFVFTWNIKDYTEFKAAASPELKKDTEEICSSLQDALKEAGDWQVYPFGVHELIAKGRVEVDGRRIFIDNREMPVFGYRLDSLKK
jgi:folate-dependent phosphoribosylglycinamide formyltransferase PurN